MKRLRRVYGKSASERSPAKQHTKTHLITLRQRNFYGPFVVAKSDRRFDDIALLPLATGVHDPAIVVGVAGAGNDRRVVTLDGVDIEPDPIPALVTGGRDVESVQGRRACAGIDLDLDVVDSEFGQARPLTPTDNELVDDVSFHGCVFTDSRSQCGTTGSEAPGSASPGTPAAADQEI